MNLRSHWPVAIVTVLAGVLLFANLGGGYLWADEGDTAVLARNILKSGVPSAWDGVTFMDSDFGARVNDRLVMVSSPWLQYYLTAASFLVFGQNTIAARLPFALAGLLTILLVYQVIFAATRDRRAAICASLLTMCSVQFLLFSRQSRYYAVAMLLTCLLIDRFLRMRSIRNAGLFTLVAVLLFHTHPIGIASVFALGALTLTSTFSAQRRPFWTALPVILALTMPWFALARAGYNENAQLVSSVREYFIRLAQYGIEAASVTPLIGVIGLIVVALITSSWRTLESTERSWLAAIFTSVLAYAAVMAATQRTAALWVTGIRYTSAILPLLAIAAAILIFRTSRGKNYALVTLMFVFVCTKFPQLTPWTFWAEKIADPENKTLALHVPIRTMDAFFPREDILFIRDLEQANIGTAGHCIEFLRQHAAPNDLIVTNYESEPLYFHTRLTQGMKISPQDPIHDVARRLGLPDYTFGLDHVRWVVWRFNWDDYLGIRWNDVSQHLLADGARIDDVAEINETGWENRENLHFHRFAGGIYLFAQNTDLAATHIFRVTWPEQM
ncbi:MAG TPA: glycosyltransferase family 39 protein [Chthoniobacterales bacterium]|nr:glycosyltransferase family 39 protein [Chthoniobacterales bacterium]